MAEVLEFVVKGKDEFTGILNKMLGGLGLFGKAAGAAVAAVAGIGVGVILMTKRVAEAHDELGKFAHMIGVSTESLSGMRYAAELSNVDVGTLNTSLRFMTRNLSEAAHGSGPAVQGLRDLGLSASKLAGMTADQQLMAIAGAMEGLGSQSDKVRIAFELFGRGGTAMLPMLSEGREKIEAMAREADRFGLIVSEQAAANADEFGDSLTRMNSALEGVRNAFVERVMPALTGFFNTLAFWVADNRKTIVDFAENALMAIGKFVEYGVYGAALMKDAWRGLKELWFLLKYSIYEVAVAIQTLYRDMTDGMITFIASSPKLAALFGGPALKSLMEYRTNLNGLVGELEGKAADAFIELNKVTSEGMSVTRAAEWVEQIKKAIEGFKAMGTASVEVSKQVGDSQAELAAQLEEVWTQWLGNSKEALTDFSTEFKAITASIWQAFSQGVGDAFAQMIVYGKSLHDAFRGLGKQLLAQMVSMLVQIGLKYIALQVLKLVLGIKEMGTRMGSLASETYGAAFASTAAIPIIGPALAPGVASASTAAMLAGATAAGAAGSATGMAIAGAAHGGLTSVPREETYLLQRGERVVSPDQNRDLKEFMAAGGGRSIVIEAIQIINPMGTSQDWDRLASEKMLPAINRALRRGLILETT